MSKVIKIPVEAKTESLKKATIKVLGHATQVAAKILGVPSVKPVIENLQNQADKGQFVMKSHYFNFWKDLLFWGLKVIFYLIYI